MSKEPIITRNLAGLAVCVFSAVLIFSGFYAAAANYSQDQQAEGTQFLFDKYLVMPENSTVPVAAFEYTITGAGNARPYKVGENHFEILDGIVTESHEGVQTAPVITWDSSVSESSGTVQFLPEDRTIAFSAATNDEKQISGMEAGKKFAKHTATVSFERILFPEPGVYRYKISETPSSQNGISNDTNLDRYLDVYVDDNGNGKLSVQGYILLSSAPDISMNETNGTSGGTVANKSRGFVNSYNSYCLTFSKNVSGNQASHDKYFQFHVKIEDAVPGTVYDVSLGDDSNPATTDGSAEERPVGNSATVYSSMSNPSMMKAENGVAECDFYLQHGQKIVIRGLVEGTKCSVTEVEEDYKAAWRLNDAGDATQGNEAVIPSVGSDNVIAFTNTREGTISTGVSVAILPFVIVAVLACGGLLFFFRRRGE